MTETLCMKADQISAGDEDRLLVLAAQKNPTAFKPLYQKWLKPVYRYFYFRLGNEADAEDLTSQVFLRAYEDLPRYREKGRFSAWLFTIAHARLVDFFRRAKRYFPLAEADDLVFSPDLLAQTAQAEEIRRMLALLRSQGEDDQELIRLHFMAELSYGEIGRIVGRKEDAVRKAIGRCLERMQVQLEDDHE